jgi:hypothetical protein
VRTQTELRLALGPRYAGEDVRLTVARGDDRLERSLTLADKLAPFQHAFLGILPLRGPADAEEQTGVVVRTVYAAGPAAVAGIRPGDRLVRINSAEVSDVRAAIDEMNNVAPGDRVLVQAVRGEETLELTLTAERLPTIVPVKLPPAAPQAANDGEAPPAGETHDLKLPQFPQTCKLYVPPLPERAPAPGVLLWVHPPGESNPDEVIRQWQPICDRDGLILVMPTAADVAQWERTEVEYLARLVQRVIRQYRPDRQRIVVYGRGGGGGMAYLLAFAGRSVFTGVATSDAPLPRQIRVPDSEPALRLAVAAGLAGDDTANLPTRQGLEKLSAAGYPVTTINLQAAGGLLGEAERNELARWIDSLDRF